MGAVRRANTTSILWSIRKSGTHTLLIFSLCPYAVYPDNSVRKYTLMNMSFGPVTLIFEKIVEVDPGGELVPFYHFRILNRAGQQVGHLNFKVGDTHHIIQCVGHIGYEIQPEYRGNSYAYFACNAIRPFIREFYDRVILTSDPDNTASIKIIERLNAKFIGEIEVPESDPSYGHRSKRKRRYEWIP